MKRNNENALKRFLKRKIRITEAIVVTFLIAGTTTYSERFVIDESNSPEDGIFTVTSEEIYNGGIDIKVPNITLNNNGNIITTLGFDATYISTGFRAENQRNGVYTTAENVEINNNGIIKGNTDITISLPESGRGQTSLEIKSSSNGVYGNVGENRGLIMGRLNVKTSGSPYCSHAYLDSNLSGNGVYGNVGKNRGTIIGELNVVTGVSTTSSISNLDYSGNGIYGNVEENTGLIRGLVNINTGDSKGSARSSGESSTNGVFGDINNNSGVIIGELNETTGNSTSNTYLTADSSANLRYSVNGVYGNVGENTGLIKSLINTTTGNSLSSSSSSSVSSKAANVNSGNGILGDVGENSGVIINKMYLSSGNSNKNNISINYSGNGVYGNLQKNSGVIESKLHLVSGLSSSNSSASSSVFARFSGNSVYKKVEENNGVLDNMQEHISSSYSTIQYSNNGVYEGINNNSGLIKSMFKATTSDSPLGDESYSSLYLTSNGVRKEIGTNNGLISGISHASIGDSSNSYSSVMLSSNGVYGEVETNNGSITGINIADTGNYSKDGDVTLLKDYKKINFSGNGIAFSKYTKNMKNTGLVAGSESAIAIKNSDSLTGSITNYGILAGREIIGDGTEIIAYDRPTDEIRDYGNYQGLSKVELSENQYKNYGIEIQFEDVFSDEDRTNDNERTIGEITNGSGGTFDIDGTSYTVLNTEIDTSGTDSYKVVDVDTAYDNHIINGAGVGTGVITLEDTNVTLNNSIVNGYEKAVTLSEGSKLVARDTIFNGGGIGTPDDRSDDIFTYRNIIEGDNTSNTIELSGNSIINGIIDLKEGDDIVTIKDNTILNGNVILGAGKDTMVVSTDSQINNDVYGGQGDDILKLGDLPISQNPLLKTTVNERSLNIYHTISDFENLNIEGSVTLYETAKVEGGESIHIEKNSSLNLRVDPTKTDDDDKVIGHALYDSGATITGESAAGLSIEDDTNKGVLNLVTNGLGGGAIISMGNTTLDNKLYVRTDSILCRAQVDGSDVTVVVGDGLDWVFGEPEFVRPGVDPIDPTDPVDPTDPIDPPTDPIDPDKPTVPEWAIGSHYEKIDLIYKSAFSSDDSGLIIDALYPTVNINDKSQDEAGENLLVLLNDIFMANPYGYAARTSKDSMGLFNEMVLNNPFRANEGNWMIYGGLTFGGDDYDSGYKNHIKGSYYGFDDYGIDINTDSDIYGGYALAEYGLSKDTSIGFIAGGANSNTSISNGSKIDGDSIYVGGYTKTEKNNFRLIAGLGYQYGDYDTIRVAGNSYQSNKYEEEISTNGFTAYAGLTYDYAINDKWSLEPKVNLSYARISQESVEEEGALSIETDKESFNYVDTELGMDLVRNIPFEDGEGKVKLGVSYVYALDGSDNDYVTGRFQGGSDFDILVPEREKGTIKIKGSFDVEHNNGVIYSVGGGYLPSENRDEYYMSLGMGFKFNDIGDFIPTGVNN
ncbi:autotransporter outer membrane beta-barrel domain-containing protein [Fusobacteria bacterium ZRK30]|nr:autotransporter outer membrane beta-barrel domain-containing protein [Fusobacteria bacterium ZRK30]